MKISVYVTLKDGIHDPQGKAVLDGLVTLGFGGVKQVRVGKYFEVELAETSVENVSAAMDQMCEQLLANTVVEKYWYQIGAA